MKTKIMALSLAVSVLCATSAFATAICPSASELNYSGGTDGMISPPAGWTVVPAYPTSPDNTPLRWEEASWTSYHGSIDIGDHVTCFYKVKGYQKNSAEGGWTIMRTQTTSDPWFMTDRPSGWIDDGSHTSQKYPMDFCQLHNPRQSCLFPTSVITTK